MSSLHGKRAFVTGASRGIGAAIARRFAAEGAAVAIGYERSADAANVIAREIEAAGGRAVAIRMNAADPVSIRQAVDLAASELGGLDILVNNAGIISYGTVEEVTLEQIDAMLAVNVRGVILATQAALPHMSAGGRIISTGSNLADRVPDAGKALYSASKAALVAWTKGAARDLGPREITVNLVHPGSTNTDMNPADGPHAEAQRQRMAIKQYGRPEDVAALYAFIASDQARSVNGTGFTVDGGRTHDPHRRPSRAGAGQIALGTLGGGRVIDAHGIGAAHRFCDPRCSARPSHQPERDARRLRADRSRHAQPRLIRHHDDKGERPIPP